MVLSCKMQWDESDLSNNCNNSSISALTIFKNFSTDSRFGIYGNSDIVKTLDWTSINFPVDSSSLTASYSSSTGYLVIRYLLIK